MVLYLCNDSTTCITENFYGRDVFHKTNIRPTYFYIFHNFHLIVKSYVEWCN